MSMKAFSFEEFKRIETEIPEELVEGARQGHANLVEKLAEFDEDLLEKFSLRCIPIVKASYLSHEIKKLRQQLQAGGEVGEVDEDSDDAPVPELQELPCFHGIVGSDEKLGKIFKIIEKIKDTDLNVCIFGESGTVSPPTNEIASSRSWTRSRLASSSLPAVSRRVRLLAPAAPLSIASSSRTR